MFHSFIILIFQRQHILPPLGVYKHPASPHVSVYVRQRARTDEAGRDLAYIQVRVMFIRFFSFYSVSYCMHVLS